MAYPLEKCQEVESKFHCGFRHRETGELVVDKDHVYIVTYNMKFEGDERQQASARAVAAHQKGYYPDYEPGAIEAWYGNPPRVKRNLPRLLKMVFHAAT